MSAHWTYRAVVRHPLCRVLFLAQNNSCSANDNRVIPNDNTGETILSSALLIVGVRNARGLRRVSSYAGSHASPGVPNDLKNTFQGLWSRCEVEPPDRLSCDVEVVSPQDPASYLTVSVDFTCPRADIREHDSGTPEICELPCFGTARRWNIYESPQSNCIDKPFKNRLALNQTSEKRTQPARNDACRGLLYR